MRKTFEHDSAEKICWWWNSAPQSIQSARLSIQSSELGPPNPLTRKRVLLPHPLWGRHTCLRGVGEPPIPTKGQSLWYSMYNIIPPLRSAPSHALTVLQVGLCKIFNDVLLGYFLHEAGAGILEQSRGGARNRFGTEFSYDNLYPTWFLANIDCTKIPARVSNPNPCSKKCMQRSGHVYLIERTSMLVYNFDVGIVWRSLWTWKETELMPLSLCMA
jgi:hypothetical protein